MKFRLMRKGYPELGKSAVEPLLDVLQELRNEKWPGFENSLKFLM